MKIIENVYRASLCSLGIASFFLLAGCAVLNPLPTSTPSPIAAPPTRTPLPSQTPTPPAPTVTPLPALSPTPLVHAGPALQYLPQLVDFPDMYEADASTASDNALQFGAIPVVPENIAAASFRNKGGGSITGAQNGVYMRFVYWVVVAPDTAMASMFFAMANQAEWQKKAFLVILPSEVEEPVASLGPLPAGQSPCEESAILSVSLDPYAAYRTGPQPTTDVKAYQPMDPKVLASLPPDLYLFAPCRVQNVLVLFWGYTANNYDGQMAPIPTGVLAGQVSQFLNVVTSKMTAQAAASP
jgi:hypothetical protein